jgi:DNA helicase HerA-like ATPase
MSQTSTSFQAAIQAGYTFKGDDIVLGVAMLDQEAVPDALVRIPLRTLNRHGLIAGATGSGKTKTLQILAEQFAAKGIPSLLMDIKGDLSGIAVAGESNEKIEERHRKIGIPFTPAGTTVELLSLSREKGARLRATVSEFGPVLFSKILGINETQRGVLSVVFKFCEDQDLPLLDLEDLKKSLQYLTNEGKELFRSSYGAISTATLGALMRKIVELEQQGAAAFFGEPSFEVDDLCRLDENGRGIVSVVRLTDIQDRPKLFSTFMLQLLAEIYAAFPEEGDQAQPRLAIFIDEAHLVFDEATPALLDQLEAIVRLVRSKGVGIFFVTQNPADIPEVILGQLGLKVQHALRAFTAKDRKSIQLAAQNYPETPYYAVDQLITQLGIGEAVVTALNEKGIPTPLAHVLLRAPQSRMGVLDEAEIDRLVDKAALAAKYNRVIDRESASEMLARKLERARSEEHQAEMRRQQASGRPRRQEKSALEEVLSSPTTRQIGRAVARELTRGLLGVLGLGTTSRRRR